MYLSGMRQILIAEHFKVTSATITRDLKAIRKQWMQDAAQTYDAYVARELARIDNLERENWEQYEASKKPTKREVRKGTIRPNQQPEEIEQTITTEQRTGDPRYLSGVQWCIEQRCKILGLYAKDKQRKTLQDAIIDQLRMGSIRPEDVLIAYPHTALTLFKAAGIDTPKLIEG